MCEHGDTVDLLVTIPARRAYEGVDTLKVRPIDRCIAPIVRALNEGGVHTDSSCCGHGNGPGEIILMDGRSLIVRGTLPAPVRASA